MLWEDETVGRAVLAVLAPRRAVKIGTQRIKEIVLSLRNFSRLDESEIKEVDINSSQRY